MRKQYTGKQRSDLVSLAKSGRATVAEAAARLGVAPSTAYYWMRGTAATPNRRAAKATFVRVVPSGADDSAIIVRVDGAEIQVRRGFDCQLLRDVVASLRGGVA